MPLKAAAIAIPAAALPQGPNHVINSIITAGILEVALAMSAVAEAVVVVVSSPNSIAAAFPKLNKVTANSLLSLYIFSALVTFSYAVIALYPKVSSPNTFLTELSI